MLRGKLLKFTLLPHPPVFIGIPGEYMKDEGKTSYRISKFWYSCYLRSWYDCLPDHWNLDLIFCLPKAHLCPD